MPKRFTATEKWDDPWFCGLSNDERLFWIYLCDKCDHAGIWQVNWPLVHFYLPGFKYDLARFDGRIVELSPEKWFIKKFVQFQYGELNPANRAHASVITILDKEGACKGLVRTLQGPKDKDKDKDKDKKGSMRGNKFTTPTPADVEEYGRSIGYPIDGVKFCAHYGATGWVRGRTKITNWKLCVQTWKKKAEENGSAEKPSWQ